MKCPNLLFLNNNGIVDKFAPHGRDTDKFKELVGIYGEPIRCNGNIESVVYIDNSYDYDDEADIEYITYSSLSISYKCKKCNSRLFLHDLPSGEYDLQVILDEYVEKLDG